MCGLFGFKLKTPLEDSTIYEAKKKLEDLKHRGPDNIGFWFDKKEGIFLGHTRLSIIDLTKDSNQPISKKNHHMIYNGEIYNHKILKKSLETKGVNFQTKGDSEVLIEEWINSGKETLLKLEGMFAFAIYDGKELIIARDIFGEKPLYYVNNKEGFFFSSEIGILKSFLNLKFSPSEDDIYSFLALGYLQGSNTGYDQIKSLSPSSIIVLDKKNNIKFKEYYKIDNIKQKNKKKSFEKKDQNNFKNILCESIESRMISDVPVGIFLSSGLDSSLIASIVSKEFNRKVDCFSVSFADGVDEFDLAKKISDYLGHNMIKIDSYTDYDWLNIPDNLFKLYETLNDNITGELVRIMSVKAKERITVALSGIGGDELFCGYNNYDFFLRNQNLLDNKYLNYLSAILYKTPIKNLERFKSFYYKVNGNNSYKYIGTKHWIYNYLVKNSSLKKIDLQNMNEENSIFSSIKKYDLQQTLPNYYLSANDLGSMRSSLEMRSPFLNKKILEFSNDFDEKFYVQNGKKFFIKNLLKEYLPQNLINKKKLGFIFPIARYIKNIKISDIKNDFIDKKTLEFLWQNKEKKDFVKFIMRLNILNKIKKND